MRTNALTIGIAAACALAFSLSCSAGPDEKQPLIPTEHETLDVEGWQVHVDARLTRDADKELGQRALKMLAAQLFDIKLMVPADRVNRLQEVAIWLDRTHGKLTSMQYHPSAGWLKGNGYSEKLAKCVHIPDASHFANAHLRHCQPFVMLHELAHSYHDRVLGFEDAEIMDAWKKFKEGGRYESTLHISGKKIKHYGLTDQKEFFAEMTEAYFGMNDFFPFNAAELKQEEPELFALLKKIWGPLP
jgi:hypothetical protein